MNDIKLFEGVTLSFCRFEKPHSHMHSALEHIIEINYCRGGRIGWDLGDGNRIFLGPGDYSIHTLRACADSRVTLPQDFYEGLSLTLDLNALSNNPPGVLDGIDPAHIAARFCKNGQAACFSGTAETEGIFPCFYNRNNPAYLRIKALEVIAHLCLASDESFTSPAQYASEQVELVRRVHDYLTEHMSERPTIEQLSRIFAVNPTTLKSTFRDVYGSSIAAHTRQHRLEAAARMLTGTSLSLNEIASAIGYESQSKFSSAFREYYNMLPSDYRKQQ